MQTIIDTVLHPFFIQLSAIIGRVAEAIWYYPVIIGCLFCGIYFTLRSGLIQFRGIPHAIQLLRGRFDDPQSPGTITHFQALMAALSGTIGLGNIAGVAIAITYGGPGAILWMWIIGLLGMATKFVEGTLGTQYRVIKNGAIFGGPMYYIHQRLPKFLKPLAYLFAISTIFGAFGAGGMFQANQAASALHTYFNIPTGVVGFLLAVTVGVVIIGGIRRIGRVAGKIVPAMCIIYILGALTICLMNSARIPEVIALIFTDAFTGQAVAGGSIGTVIIWGIRRAVFSNEAGLGSSAIAHAAVKTDYPIREGVVASIGPFIDTILVCTATAIVIILGGQYHPSAKTHASAITFDAPIAMHANHAAFRIESRDDGQGNRVVYQASDTIETYTSPLFTVAKPNTTWYGTPTVDVLGNGIRFKTKRGRGNYAVLLRDAQGNRVTGLKLHGDEKYFFVSQPNKTDVTMVHFKIARSQSNNEWTTHTIEFLSDTAEWIQSKDYLHQMSLQIIVDKNSAGFELDDISVSQPLTGIALTIASFDQFIHGFGSVFITVAVLLFAFSTIITWSYYGESAMVFLWGPKGVLPFKVLMLTLVFLGSLIGLKTVINFSDAMIGLMVIPNVIALLYLSEDVFSDAYDYFKQLKANAFKRYD
jgi:AGCS family alanine or glycine:cation symporter